MEKLLPTPMQLIDALGDELSLLDGVRLRTVANWPQPKPFVSLWNPVYMKLFASAWDPVHSKLDMSAPADP